MTHVNEVDDCNKITNANHVRVHNMNAINKINHINNINNINDINEMNNINQISKSDIHTIGIINRTNY